MTDLSKYCSAFNGCNYCTDLKNFANVTKTFKKKKGNIAEPTDMVELSNVAVLSNVANITVPSRYCKVFEKFANIAKCCIVFHKEKKKSDKVCKCYRAYKYGRIFTNVAEFASLSNVANCRVLKIVQLLQTFFKKKERNKKNVMLQSLQRWQNFQNVAVLPMLQIFQYLQIMKSVAEFYTK